ncbi:histidine phosphatase family protein [Roseibium sp. RKSG952]|uniref:histidine phosphatase family protein n=1 Tax=Roseibium sp. RKSG952 TaxID=2529384 RepID=UPI0012BD2676|nr:histidine phosphatase family protein [Roseibium sp. RKSG952]MTH96313.1 histidine phosphatase family protein [Roseibium sp. RKSG952]
MTLELDTETAENLPRLHDPNCLIFIRHGQTDWNAEGRMQGQKDIPLNETGREQARGNGRRLKAFFENHGCSVNQFRFVASPMDRTRETMALVRENMDLDPSGYELDDQLRELTFGSWEGSTIPELAEVVPDLVEERRRDKWAFVPPGGGESYAMLSERIGKWLVTVDRPTVVVAHGGVFRAVNGLLQGLPKRDVPRLDVPQDRVFLWQDTSMSWI